MKSLQQQSIIILSYDSFYGVSAASFKENTIKTIYAANAGFAEVFRWSFFGKKGIVHL